jgi:hypothetical protein
MPAGDGFRDTDTRTHWKILGAALSGPLAGKRLESIVHGDHFWLPGRHSILRRGSTDAYSSCGSSSYLFSVGTQT